MLKAYPLRFILFFISKSRYNPSVGYFKDAEKFRWKRNEFQSDISVTWKLIFSRILPSKYTRTEIECCLA